MNEEDIQQNDTETLPQETPEQDVKGKEKASKWDVIINVALTVIIVVLLGIICTKMFVLSNVTVIGVSMNPTYVEDDEVLVNRLARPKRGDVVVFYTEEVPDPVTAYFKNSKKLIKRVVALEGDKIWLERKDGGYRVYVMPCNSDEILQEDYYVHSGETLEMITISEFNCGNLADCVGFTNAYTVPDGCFYAMGDNRNNSSDSRAIGAIPYEKLYGVVIDK